jgi:hypothetical protein
MVHGYSDSWNIGHVCFQLPVFYSQVQIYHFVGFFGCLPAHRIELDANVTFFIYDNLQHSAGTDILIFIQTSILLTMGCVACNMSLSYIFLTFPCTGIYAHFVTLDSTGREERQPERLLQSDLICNSWTKWRNYCCWLSHSSIFCKRGLPWRTLSRRKRLSLYLVNFVFLDIRERVCYELIYKISLTCHWQWMCPLAVCCSFVIKLKFSMDLSN